MNLPLIFIGVVLLVLAYLIGVKKYTWLLSGFNQHRVRDKEKLGNIVGLYNLIVGSGMVVGGVLNIMNSEVVMPIVIVGYILLIIYVQKNLVE